MLRPFSIGRLTFSILNKLSKGCAREECRMERTFGLSPRQHRTLLGMLLGQKMREWYHHPVNHCTRTPSFTPVSCQNAAFASLFWANTALSTQKADACCHHSRLICPQAGNSFARLSQDSSPKRLSTVVVDSPSGASKGHKSVEHRKRAIPETAKHAIPGHGCPSMQCPSEWLPKLRSRHGLNSNSASFADTP